MNLNPEKCKALVLAREPNAGNLLKVLPYGLVTIFRDMFGLTLDDSLTFVKRVRKISTEESWKGARIMFFVDHKQREYISKPIKHSIPIQSRQTATHLSY